MYYIVDEAKKETVFQDSNYDTTMDAYISLTALHPKALLVIKHYEKDELAMACDGDSEPFTDWDYYSPQP